MNRLRKIAALAGLAIALGPVLVGEARSVEILLPPVGSATVQNNAGDLRALENRLQRQQYQQQQQQFRAEDRLSIPLQRQTPHVPAIRPGCQVQVYGNNGIVRGCR